MRSLLNVILALGILCWLVCSALISIMSLWGGDTTSVIDFSTYSFVVLTIPLVISVVTNKKNIEKTKKLLFEKDYKFSIKDKVKVKKDCNCKK
jgi:hypothetical protein